MAWFDEIRDKLGPAKARYTCPICREIIGEAPTQVLAMRDICQFIAASNGEAIHKEPLSLGIRSPWLRFFPTHRPGIVEARLR